MTKRTFGLALLIAGIGISMIGCTCGPQKMAEAPPAAAAPPAVVKQAPPPAPAVVQPAPAAKSDRN